MTSVRRVLSPVSPRRWPDLWGKVLPNYRRSALVFRLRYHAWRFHAKVDVDIDRNVVVGKRINVELRPWSTSRLRVGSGSTIGDDVRLRLRNGAIELGEAVDVRPGVVLSVGGGTLVIDGPNLVGRGSVVHCAESVHLAERAYTGEYVTIVDSSHVYTAADEWSYRNTRSAPIDIGVDVWICPKATITSGVTIGDYTIVASNSVVVKDAPGGVLLSGVPATIVRQLDHPWLAEKAPGVETG
jgi:acetyltransferase-like isoleucine patch superfamily enzyme